ncbi:hypothetical protein SDC9_119823 [bioreactor metagenome]|uniref:Uncharacterized protein n=1 Tax=bioreactor metagenome TaxID=1076179 RepID=A0A645C6R2_9ZZZZ
MANFADGSRGGNDVFVKRIAHSGEVGQHVVGGEFRHPAAVHHAEVVCALCVHGVESNLGVQFVECQFEHFAGAVIGGFKFRQSGLNDVAIGAAAKNQRQLGRFLIRGSGFRGSLRNGGVSGVGLRGRFLRGLCASGKGGANHGKNQQQCGQFFHSVSLLFDLSCYPFTAPLEKPCIK